MLNLLNNIVTGMHGPQFLLFYAVFIALVIAGVYYRLRRNTAPDASRMSTQLPTDPDPYKIALLHGDTTVIKLGLMRLLESKAIRTNSTGGMLSPTGKQSGDLNPFEKSLLKFLRRDTLSRQVLTDEHPKKLVERHFGEVKKEYEAAGLLSTISKAQRQTTKAIGAGLIAGLGLYKLFAALAARHYNVMFLILMGIIGMVIVAFMRKPQLTNTGNKYLKRLRTAYGSLPLDRKAPEALEQASLAAAITGFAILNTGDWAYLDKVFSHQPAHINIGGGTGGGYSCGASCGASCGGGGGCGGCGGCGG